MRRATAIHVILVVVAYVALATFLLAWARDTIRRSAWGVMESTAQLVSVEIASALHHDLENLLERPAEETEDALASIVELVERSATVLEATVVADDGRVLASTRDDAPATLEPPDSLFADEGVIRIESVRGRPLDDGRFVVDVPVRTGTRIDGYIRLSLTSDRLGAIVHDTYLVVLAVAVIGLVAILLAVLSLHLRYSRALRRVVSALTRHEDDAGRTDASVDTALRSAEGLHRRLMTVESDRTTVRQRLDSLADTLDIGIVLVDGDRNVELATDRARTMLADLEAEPSDSDPVEGLVMRLEPLFASTDTEPGRRRCVIPDDPAEAGALQVEVATVGDPASGGWVIQLRDRRGVMAVTRDLLEAARVRSLAQLFLGVTHDLKAPLNAMVLTVGNLKARAESMAQPVGERETTLEMLSVVEREAHRLERALEALFAHTVTAATLPSRFDLVEMVETTSHLVASQSRQQGVRFELQLPDRPVEVNAAEDHIRQAVLNLAVNALEELGERRDGALTISLEEEDHTAVLRVTDNGDGVPELVSESLFDLHVTTKDSGTGIGLYVARMAVEDAGGSLQVERTGSEGTVFRLTLPLAKGGA